MKLIYRPTHMPVCTHTHKHAHAHARAHAYTHVHTRSPHSPETICTNEAVSPFSFSSCFPWLCETYINHNKQKRLIFNQQPPSSPLTHHTPTPPSPSSPRGRGRGGGDQRGGGEKKGPACVRFSETCLLVSSLFLFFLRHSG